MDHFKNNVQHLVCDHFKTHVEFLVRNLCCRHDFLTQLGNKFWLYEKSKYICGIVTEKI